MGLTLQDLRPELRPMLRLAVPVVLGELGWMAMGVVDTMMVGRIDAEAIGAVGLGRAIFLALAVCGIGLLLGLDTLVSQAFGAGELDRCRALLIQGAYLSLLITPPLMAASRGAGALVARWPIDEAVLVPALRYLHAISWSALPIFLYSTLRRYLQAMNLVRPVMLALVSANLVNLVANWILIFGNLGAPALGAEGAAWATGVASCYLALFLLAAVLLHEREQGWRLLRVGRWPVWGELRRLLALGGPAALHLLLEVGVFALATALAGRLLPAALAAHQIALNAASVTYMVPLGISSAAAVRVGQSLGRRELAGARRAGWTAMLFGGGFMLLAAAVFLLLPYWIVRAFTTDTRVVAVGVTLLWVAALFQLFDGVQVVATGALRGAGDTRTPLVLNLIGYWVLGLPVGYALCFNVGWGVVGLWLGLSLGLIVVGSVLLAAWSRRTRDWH